MTWIVLSVQHPQLPEIANRNKVELGNTDSHVIENVDVENVDAGTATHRRVHRAPQWMNEYVSGEFLSDDELNMVTEVAVLDDDPVSFTEAIKDQKWRHAMDSEISSIELNKT